MCRCLILSENADGHYKTHVIKAEVAIADYEDRRQLRLVMMALNEVLPGIVCFDTTCRQGVVPHMASDGADHPHPYGVIESPTHEWRKKRRRDSV
jgi:hypothetical protein